MSSSNTEKRKNCVITGATAGIGAMTTAMMAARGFDVIGIGSSEASCNRAAVWLDEQISNGEIPQPSPIQDAGSVQFLDADLSSQDSVKKLGNTIREQISAIDVLINNAGVITLTRRLTADGIEYTFAVNHLAPFMLTQLVMPQLMTQQSARIVNVASQVYSRNFDTGLFDPGSTSEFDPLETYRQSKLANILFTRSLARYLESTSIRVNCLHPGVVETGFLQLFEQAQRAASSSGKMKAIKRGLKKLIGKPTSSATATVNQAAERLVFLATHASVNSSGQYYVDNVVADLDPVAQDEKNAEDLWHYSRKLTGLPEFDPGN